MGRLVAPKHAAEVLDVKPRRIYRLIELGLLQGVRIGEKQIRVTRTSLNRLAREGTNGGMKDLKAAAPDS